MESIAKDVCELLAVRFEEKRLSLSLEASEDLPIIQSDPVRLHQILVNLVGNALKFTQQGGVRIVLRQIDVEDDQFVNPGSERQGMGRKGFEVAVVDTGVGIEKDMLQKLLQGDAFRQANTSINRSFGML